jgi:hypothetical protein
MLILQPHIILPVEERNSEAGAKVSVMEGAVLGFDDCSAKVTAIPDANLTIKKPFVVEHEELEVKGWSFYAFNVTADDYQVVVNLVGERDDNCEPLDSVVASASFALKPVYLPPCQKPPIVGSSSFPLSPPLPRG